MGDWHRTAYSTDINPKLDGEEVTLFGWVQEIRDLGGIRFIILRDKNGLVQVTISRKTTKPILIKKAETLQREYVIGVRGTVKKIEKAPRGAEIIPTEIKILNNVQHPLPLDPTALAPADLDVRLNSRILDLRRPESQAIFRIKHRTVSAVHDFFVSNGYFEVHTPKIISSATEGGAALFPIAYYEKEAFLAQSPQLYKEQLTSAFEKVFEIGPIFRAEESHTTRHLSEVISIDMEEAFTNAEGVMKTLEEMIVYIFKIIIESCAEELTTLKRQIEVPKTPFAKYTYEDVLKELRKNKIAIKWGEDITTTTLKTLSELHRGFYFITEWPTQSKPFYIQPCENNPKVCEAFDLMHSWIEVSSGGTRVHSKNLLIKRIKEQGLEPQSFEYHIKAFEYGMPPHAGWAVGLDRLIMVITGKENIREVVLFPRDQFRLTP
ncbi:MAG TPA: aspartate--tRNA(Asn) ligase [archaeon]|nr:aspartate--tRNA(Asn) ligase [archaeon]